MSYILDALKRSQQEFELDKAPTLFKESYTETAPTKRTNRAVLVALALALLAVLISLYAAFGSRLFMGEKERQTSSEPVVNIPVTTPSINETKQRLPAEKQPAIEIEPVAEIKKERPTRVQKQRDLTALKDSAVDTDAGAEKNEPAKAPADTQPGPVTYRQELLELKQQIDQQEKEIKPLSETEGASVEENVRTSIKPDSEQMKTDSEQMEETNRPVTEQQLAASFRSRLPSRDISVHVYSANPQDRFVFINSRKMMEGERTGDGLTVEEIHSDGIVLSFEGQRFYKPL